MLMKSCPARVKAAGEQDGLPEGQFEAIVSVFGNVDSYGDVVMPGAFKDTLAEWESSGNPIPVYYSHRMDDPDFNIGHVVEAAELLPGDPRLPDDLKDLGGLWVKAQLDIDAPVPGSKAPQVHRLLKGRRITQFSFAYDVDEGGWAKRDDQEFYELRKLRLYEVGPTPIGANQETELLAVKSAMTGLARQVKAGRLLPTKAEDALREARDAIDSVLASLSDAEDGKSTRLGGSDQEQQASEPPAAKDPASDEAPAGKSSVASEEPPATSPVDAYLAVISIQERN